MLFRLSGISRSGTRSKGIEKYISMRSERAVGQEIRDGKTGANDRRPATISPD
jgi:hypothetical protein